MPNGTYGGVRGEETKVGQKTFVSRPTRFCFPFLFQTQGFGLDSPSHILTGGTDRMPSPRVLSACLAGLSVVVLPDRQHSLPQQSTSTRFPYYIQEASRLRLLSPRPGPVPSIQGRGDIHCRCAERRCARQVRFEVRNPRRICRFTPRQARSDVHNPRPG